jgi:Leucine-rich repeat (LRR) protein
MSNDIEVIARIKKKLEIQGFQFIQFQLEEIIEVPGINKGFALDNSNHVVGLRMENLDLRPFLDDIRQLKHIRIIYFYLCQLDDASFLKEMKEITFLDLSANKLTDVSFLEGLYNLEFLELSDNPIERPSNEIRTWGPLKGSKIINKYLRYFDLRY